MSILKLRTLGTLLIILSWSPITLAEQLNSSPWYITASVGQVTGNLSTSDIKKDLSSRGVSATDILVDSDRVGYSLNLGYKFNDHFSVVAGYVDLNDVNVEITAEVIEPDKFVEQVGDIHPSSAYGFTLGAEYIFELTEQFNIGIGSGLYLWQGDFISHESTSGSLSSSDDVSGTDIYYSVSAEYQITKPLGVILSWQRFNLVEDKADMWSMGLKYSF